MNDQCVRAEIQAQEVGEDCWSITYSSMEEHCLQRSKVIRAEPAEVEEEETKQQASTESMKRMTKRIEAKGGINTQERWWVSGWIVEDCASTWLNPKRRGNNAELGEVVKT